MHMQREVAFVLMCMYMRVYPHANMHLSVWLALEFRNKQKGS